MLFLYRLLLTITAKPLGLRSVTLPQKTWAKPQARCWSPLGSSPSLILFQ